MIKRYVECERDGLVLRGFLTLPSAPQPSGVPLLVFFHGFTDTLAGKHFLFSRMASTLAEHGVAMLRFDFAGSGESDGSFSDMTLATELADSRAIFAFARDLEGIDRAHIMAGGHSLGGTVAVCLAAEEGESVSRLVLLAPGVIHHKKMERMLEEEGWCGNGALVLDSAYPEIGYGYDPVDYAPRCMSPVVMIRGTEDTAIPSSASDRLFHAFPKARLVEIEGAAHSFDTVRHNKQLFETVVTACSKA